MLIPIIEDDIARINGKPATTHRKMMAHEEGIKGREEVL